MLREGGYAVWVTADGDKVERSTFTCVHCGTVVFVAPKCDPSDLGGFCTLCMRHTCKSCAGKSCVPFEKKLEAIERRDRLRQAAGA